MTDSFSGLAGPGTPRPERSGSARRGAGLHAGTGPAAPPRAVALGVPCGAWWRS
ncbi:hypothetical protein [Streptomyces sp. PU-14G]|uniref:hypothetical protein n=1 Tax=Streptomyces sp. PU-14G TaxID=2800808 RepID=UPI0034E04D4D